MPIMTEERVTGSLQWAALLDELAGDETILEQTVHDIRATVPGYDNVPTDALKASASRNISMSVRTIRTGLSPSPDDVDEADTLAAERYDQGVPLGSVLAGFRVCLSIILHRLLERAPRNGIPTEQVLATSTLLWDLGDAFSARAVVVYQHREVSRALADNAHRVAWIGNALAGTLPQRDLLRGAALYRVPTAEPLRAITLRPAPESFVEARQQLDSWVDDADVQVLTAVRAGALVGILIGDPGGTQPDLNLAIGVGRPVLIDDLPSSFESATLALQSAERVGLTGLADLERLSWRRAVEASPETTEYLTALHLGPLQGTGEFGDHVLEAVEAYLAHRLSIPLAARSIPVHVNTLRYRLHRFSELTGADLGDVDTLIELSWVLAARRGDPRA